MQLIVSILSPRNPPRIIGDLTLEPNAPITIGGLETDTVWLGDGIDATHRLTMNLLPARSPETASTTAEWVELKSEVFSADVGPVVFHRGDRDRPVLAAGHGGRLPPTLRYLDIDPLAEITVFRLTLCGVEIRLAFVAGGGAEAYQWLSGVETATGTHFAATAVHERLGEIGFAIKGLVEAAAEHGRVLNDVADSMAPCQVHGDIDPVETSVSPRGTKAPPAHGGDAERRAAIEEAIRESKAHRMQGRLVTSEEESRRAEWATTTAEEEADKIRSRIDAAGAAGGVQWIRVEVYRSNLHISGASFAAPCLIRIGALKSSEIFLQDEGVARLHAAIEAATDTVRLIDLGSAFGTRLAGEEIDKNAELKDGDEIEIRDYRIVVHFDRAEVGDRRPASYAWLSRRKAGPGVKPLVYVAGPYTADTDEQRLANIAAAQAWGAKVIDAGGIPVIPHNMSEGIADKGDAEFWYAATLELMLRCDAVLLMPRAGESIGARAEEEAAHEIGMPAIDADKLPPGVRLGDCISGIVVPSVDPHAAARRRRDRDARELKRIKDLRSQVSELRQLRHAEGGNECN